MPPPAVISRAVTFQVSSLLNVPLPSSCQRNHHVVLWRFCGRGTIGSCEESHFEMKERLCIAILNPMDGVQGFSCVLTGLIGSGNATTACELDLNISRLDSLCKTPACSRS